MSLGTRIRQCRLKAGLSQEKLAELLGISRQAVTKWESDQSAPSTENLFRLADILGTTVDFLIAPEDSSHSAAEEVFQMLRNEELRKKTEKHNRRQKNFYCTLAVAAGYLFLFLLCKLFWCNSQDMTILGWLLGTDPQNHAYLFGWLLNSKLYLYCSIISIAAAALGWRRFSLTSLAGFTLGLPMGEFLGRIPGILPDGYHYGWAIWGGIFIVSLGMAIRLQRFPAEELNFSSKKLRAWCSTALLLVIAVLVFVLLNIPPAHY